MDPERWACDAAFHATKKHDRTAIRVTFYLFLARAVGHRWPTPTRSDGERKAARATAEADADAAEEDAQFQWTWNLMHQAKYDMTNSVQRTAHPTELVMSYFAWCMRFHVHWNCASSEGCRPLPPAAILTAASAMRVARTVPLAFRKPGVA